jgi:hypothetical protein
MKRTAVNPFARFCVIVCCSASTLFADDLFERARSQAIDMTHAFQRHDAKAIVRYTAEPIVKRKGGAEALEKLLTAEFAEMKKDNAKTAEIRVSPARPGYIPRTATCLC